MSRRRRSGTRRMLALPLVLLGLFAIFAAAFVAYVLWPRWPAAPVALDAPTLPITVAGVTFSIPPSAIRQSVQRRPGTQDRVDLAFLWPSLEPPDPKLKPGPATNADGVDRIFVTIAASDTALPPAERVSTIYPRYLDNAVRGGPGGLTVRPFRDGTPYQGEELIYDSVRGFLVRCTQNGKGGALGICLHDRRLATADMTIRFPRDWLEDWPSVAHGIEKLVASLRASAN
jgi:hypothetical protein